MHGGFAKESENRQLPEPITFFVIGSHDISHLNYMTKLEGLSIHMQRSSCKTYRASPDGRLMR
jgi:hypothetical protein